MKWPRVAWAHKEKLQSDNDEASPSDLQSEMEQKSLAELLQRQSRRFNGSVWTSHVIHVEVFLLVSLL